MPDGKHDLQSSDNEDDKFEYRIVEARSVADPKTVEIAAQRDQQRDARVRSIWYVFIRYIFEVIVMLTYIINGKFKETFKNILAIAMLCELAIWEKVICNSEFIFL